MREGYRTNLFLRCWMLPRHLKVPFTIMAKRPQRASHSSILWHKRHLHSYLVAQSKLLAKTISTKFCPWERWNHSLQSNIQVYCNKECSNITVTDCTCHYLWQLKMWLYISKDHIHGIGKCTCKCMQDYINFGQRDTCMGLKLSSSHILYITQMKCTYLSYQFLCDAK